MTLRILPYDITHYNSLPELHKADILFREANILVVLDTELATLFVAYRVEKTLGVVLLHNHFLMEPGEMLVTVGNSAVPWRMDSGAPELKDVVPKAWRFVNGDIVPYEFEHGASRVDLEDRSILPFIHALQQFLHEKALDGIIGICSLNGRAIERPSTMEFTSGRANITLPFDVSPGDDDSIDAEWHFHSAIIDTGNGARTVGKGKCKQKCKGKPHSKRHLSYT